MRRILSLLFFIPLPALADQPAPPLRFEAGTVLSGGHVLAEAVTLPPQPGPVTLTPREGAPLHWRILIEQGETRLLDAGGHWAAKAEYHRLQRDGRTVCQIYQTTISPEWAVRGADRQSRADYAPVDDRVYAFREVDCP